MQILDGKKASDALFRRLKPRILTLKKKGVTPGLVFFLVGNDPSSVAYVSMKERAAKGIGIASTILRYRDDVTQTELLKKIRALNKDSKLHGMMIQLPLPPQLKVPEVTAAFASEKDADGFHPRNFGSMSLGADQEWLTPATALGIIRLLEFYRIDLSGKEVTVLGRSNLVGKPTALMLLNRGATVTVCHSKTTDTASHCRLADIIVAATGVPHLVKADWVKDGAIVIDAGYAKLKGKVVGDVDFDPVSKKCSWITPVPGGCGPMTIYSIIENTVKAAESLST